MSLFGHAVPTLNPTMDGEHRIQAGLINALCNAIETGKPVDEVGQILQQLIDYSEVHFMSEELLMRLDSYDEFEGHVDDHVRMLESLTEMAQDHRGGHSDLVPGKARSTLAFLLKHIETRDARYVQSLRA